MDDEITIIKKSANYLKIINYYYQIAYYLDSHNNNVYKMK